MSIFSRTHELFVFGDSLSDIGRVYSATLGLVPPSPPYFRGRFSNGSVAVETLASELGLTLNRRTNFATGGATTGHRNNNDSPTLQLGGLIDQVSQFRTQAERLGAGSEDLYVVWAGANDFLSRPADPQAAIVNAITNIANSVEQLVLSGAKNILVAQTPNLGRVPASLSQGLLEPLTQLSKTFNNQLAIAINNLEAKLGNANLIVTDLFAIGEVIAQRPSAFGFSNITTPYLNGLTPADPNADPNTFFFWDNVHPTTKSHSIYAGELRQSAVNNIFDSVNRAGTLVDDLLVGFSGSDRLAGLLGNDSLQGNNGSDTLIGNQGNDLLDGGNGDDLLFGGEGNDTARGQAGNDRLFGESGNDLLEGGIGDDLLSGGKHTNRLKGDAGADRFALAIDGSATILDFTDRQDVMVLPRNVTFDQLNVTQSGRAILVTTNSGTLLATLRGGLNTSLITSADFVAA